MILHHDPLQFKEWRNQISKDIRVGFVPTMGALHQGHSELLNRAKSENDLLVLSIFINPTQFNNKDDYEKYPQTTESDLMLARELKVDAVFLPDSKSMYPDDYRYQIVERDFSKHLCGAFRPGHFQGMLSIVMKLFQLTKPTHAYFGEKDFQQLKLIQGMAQAFFLDVKVVPVPTVRESSGLALSSRNARLSPEQKARAPLLYKALTESRSTQDAKDFLLKNDFKVEYIEDIENRRYAAAYLGEVRLIDNVQI